MKDYINIIIFKKKCLKVGGSDRHSLGWMRLWDSVILL